MSKSAGKDGISEAFQDFLGTVARVLLGLGALATLGSAGLLVYTCFHVAGDASVTQEALKNVSVLQKVLLFGAMGVGVGASVLFWGEELASAVTLMVAALLFFAPAIVPMAVDAGTNAAYLKALAALQMGGAVLGVVAGAVLVLDLAGRMRQRAKVGVRKDQLKYGKGVKEENDKQNVFLGKCWQLPYCRKFVRERCPIFHARRTCWRERVGCMCEEEVIRKAMESKPIPKAQLLDGSAIPRNHRLNERQKAERCRNCVIYNEHQRHKYRAAVPIVLVAYLLVYAGLHTPLVAAMTNVMKGVNGWVGALTITSKQKEIPQFFVEGLLFFAALLLLTYSMKFLEYLVFKLKI